MMKLNRVFPFLFVLILILPLAVNSQPDNGKLKVALRLSPPFIMKSDNQYVGVSVDLWEQIAPSTNRDFEYVEYTDLGLMLRHIEEGKVDLCINPLTVTSERLTRFSFTQPYFISGIAIAVKVSESNGILGFLKSLFSWEFLEVVFLLFFVIFIFGFLIWLVERRKNPDQFHKGLKGIGQGFWWSAVTMTTVGYGDKSPTTGFGRFISIIWMFTAVIIISSFTASISAALTYNKFKTDIRGINDLYNVKVGTLQNSSTASYLSESRINFQGFTKLDDAVDALEAGKLDAVVYDEPILRYNIYSRGLSDYMELIPSGANSVYFGYASKNMEFLEEINPHLINAIEGSEWSRLLESYNLRVE
jgi:ABC-type amino acid transport substrate-binding protein